MKDSRQLESGHNRRYVLRMPSILFVCLGNICRSPPAEAALRRGRAVLLGARRGGGGEEDEQDDRTDQRDETQQVEPARVAGVVEPTDGDRDAGDERPATRGSAGW